MFYKGLPHWLYVRTNARNSSLKSTTTGAFNPVKALLSTNPFEAATPSVQTDPIKKKRVIISDYSLRYVPTQTFVKVQSSLFLLHMAGYQIFTVDKNHEMKRFMEKVAPRNHIDKYTRDEAILKESFDALVNSIAVSEDTLFRIDPDYTTDGSVILDFSKLRELFTMCENGLQGISTRPCESCFGSDKTNPYLSYLNEYVIPYYMETGLSLEGQTLPEIELNYFDLVELLSSEHRHKLQWGFTFMVAGMRALKLCLNTPDFPHDKIVGLALAYPEDIIEKDEYFEGLGSSITNSIRKINIRSYADSLSSVIESIVEKLKIHNIRTLNISSQGNRFDVESVMKILPRIEILILNQVSVQAPENRLDNLKELLWAPCPNETPESIREVIKLLEKSQRLKSLTMNPITAEVVSMISSNDEFRFKLSGLKSFDIKPNNPETQLLPLVQWLHKKLLGPVQNITSFRPHWRDEARDFGMRSHALEAVFIQTESFRLGSLYQTSEDWMKLKDENHCRILATRCLPADMDRIGECLSVRYLDVILSEPDETTAKNIAIVAKKLPNLMHINLITDNAATRWGLAKKLTAQDFSGNKYKSQIKSSLKRIMLYGCNGSFDHNIPAILGSAGELRSQARAQQRAGYIYDREDESDDRVKWRDTHGDKFEMIPICKVLTSDIAPRVVRRNVHTLVDGVKAEIAPVFAQLPDATNLIPTHEFCYEEAFKKIEDGIYRVKLRMCSPQDIITKVDTLHGTLKYSTSDNFYYLECSTDPGKVQIKYKLHSPEPNVPRRLMELADFYRKTYEPDNRTNVVRGSRDANLNPQYYSCSQRCAAFFRKYNHLQPRLSTGGAHCRIEVRDANNKVHLLDLGGKPSNMNYHEPAEVTPENTTVTTTAPKKEKRHDFRAHETLSTVTTLDEQLSSTVPNTLLIFEDEELLESAKFYIAEKLSSSVIEIDRFEDLQTTAKYFSIDNDSALILPPPGGWLINQLEDKRKNLLLIDWSNFSPREAAQSNSCLGPVRNRKIQNYSLGADKKIVGMVLKDSPLLLDSSFISRHHKNVYHVAYTAIPTQPNQPQGANDTNANKINVQLYSSKDWFQRLMGKIELVDGKLIHKKGPMLTHRAKIIQFENPPMGDKDFIRFIKRIQRGIPIRYLDQSIRFEPITIRMGKGYRPDELSHAIISETANVTDDMLPDNVYIVNTSTVERAITTNKIVNNRLIAGPGWIETSPENEIHVFMSTPLSEHQRAVFMQELRRCGKKAVIYTAPSQIANASSQNRDPVTISTVTLSKDDLIIDISGLSPDALTYGYSSHLEGGEFRFKELTSDIWLRLQSGKNVYLVGDFSDELIDHLSTMLLPNPYLWKDGKKNSFPGKLFLSPNRPIPRLSWLKKSTSIIQLIHPVKNVICMDANEPDSGALAFHEARVNAIDKVLLNEPAVLIFGDPGIGKSSFIRFLKDDKRRNIFSENQLQDWANYKGNDPVYLVIDEASSRDSDFSIFTGLYTHSPALLINGKIYPINVNQKVIFLGNLLPGMPILFKKVAKIRFKKMSADHMIEYILKPIFSDMNAATQHYQDHSTLSARAIQAKAISVCAQNTPTYRAPMSLSHFILTESRRPFVKSLVNFLNAREIMIKSNQYGGQTGFWVEGPAGIGKTEIIQAILDELNIQYTLIPASTDPETMMKNIRTAFQNGQIIVIDELDTALDPTRIAEINAYLMGEDLNFERPHKNGFALIATGNGPKFTGRLALPESLLSRMICHKMEQYPEDDCLHICSALFPTMNYDMVKEQIDIHLAYPNKFSFRTLISHIGTLASVTTHTAKPFIVENHQPKNEETSELITGAKRASPD